MEQRLILEALLVMATVSFVIRFLPFRVLKKLINAEAVKVNDYSFFEEGGSSASEMTHLITKVITVTGNKITKDSKCLVQASSARIMLNKRGIPSTLYLGVKKNEIYNMKPHAWLVVNDQVMLGGGELDQYVPVSRLE